MLATQIDGLIHVQCPGPRVGQTVPLNPAYEGLLLGDLRPLPGPGRPQLLFTPSNPI
jgi:hypothetical protein